MTTTITIHGQELNVTAVVGHDPGCWTLPNGDPGWPETWAIDDITELRDPDGKDYLPQHETDPAFAALVDDAIITAFQEEDGPDA